MTAVVTTPLPTHLVSAAHELAEGVLRPHASGWDREGTAVGEGLRAARDAGLFTSDWRVPQEDTNVVGALQVFEELAWGCPGFAYAAHAASLAARVVRTVGSPDQQHSLLPLVSDTGTELRIGGLAVSEPQSGSDVSAVGTLAKADGDTWVLTGQKSFVTNGLDAHAILVYATTDRSLGWAGIAPYLVPRDAPGLEITPTPQTLGLRAGRYGTLQLTDCRIPAGNRLGAPEDAPSIRALSILESSRPVVAAIAVGLARAAYEYALAHCKAREQFGKPLAAQQSVAFTLADMAMQIQAARLLTWHAATLANTGAPQRQGESSMAKCFATEMAMRVASDAVQLLGGSGCTADHPVEKWLRDAKLLEVCEGPSAIQRLIISRAIMHG